MSHRNGKSPFNWDNWPDILPGPDGSGEEESWVDLSASKKKETLRRDAETGLVSAQLKLGLNLLYGEDGFEKDPQEAVKWLGAAAKQGDSTAQYNLADCFEKGSGCEKNIVKAKFWCRKAAKQGCTASQRALRRLKQK